MKIPALRAKIGNWDYYVTTLTFDQVNVYVSKIDENLHKSESLKDLIQRSITNNYLSIKGIPPANYTLYPGSSLSTSDSLVSGMRSRVFFSHS